MNEPSGQNLSGSSYLAGTVNPYFFAKLIRLIQKLQNSLERFAIS
jgi:hypothetical protein